MSLEKHTAPATVIKEPLDDEDNDFLDSGVSHDEWIRMLEQVIKAAVLDPRNASLVVHLRTVGRFNSDPQGEEDE